MSDWSLGGIYVNPVYYSIDYSVTLTYQPNGVNLDDTRFRMDIPEINFNIAQDLFLFGGGDVDLYGYVENNLINKIHPLGLSEGSACRKTRSERLMEEFEANRVPGANIFGVPTSLLSLGASVALTEGPSLGEKVAQHFATGAFESQRLTGHGIYLKNYRPGFFNVSGAFRLLGNASWAVTAFIFLLT
jgi:hypothetical protein